ncbi:unnamed protein product [Parajaminaea phylloscopi]
MGIQGLLPLLKEIQDPIHVSRYRGQTLGIDGYVWLHRGAYGCAKALAKGEPTTKYINYALHRIRMLQHHGVTPYVVFDGDRLPSKAGTENDREQRRVDSRAKADELSARGQEAAAFEHYAKCVDVTPEMAFQLIKALRAQGIKYVVAPYEADAQLAFLERHGLIDAVVTEDSDLLVFGCKRVLFKMDADGRCIEIQQANLTACKRLSFVGWTTDLFRQMAILSGCDYLPSIQGLGLKNAHKLLQRHKSVRRALQAVRLEGKLRVPPDYQSQFEQAEKTFLHQRVWDPRNQCLSLLQPLETCDLDNSAILHYIGPDIEHSLAQGIAMGEVDPITRLTLCQRGPQIASTPQRVPRRKDVPQTVSSPYGRAGRSLEKGQQGLSRFLSIQAATTPSARTPLAPMTMNKPNPAASVEPRSVRRSKFFATADSGEDDRGAGTLPATGAIAMHQHEVHSDDPPSHPLFREDSERAPISGFGDFFCELDGADGIIFGDSAIDEAEPDVVCDSAKLPPTAEAKGIAACFLGPTPQCERDLPVVAGSLCSDMSDVGSTPEKAGWSECTLSSPFEDDHDDQQSCDGSSQRAAETPRQSKYRHRQSSVEGEDIVSFSDSISARSPVGHSPCPEFAEPSTSPSAASARSARDTLKRKRQAEPVDGPPAVNVDASAASGSRLASAWWQRYAHDPASSLNTGRRQAQGLLQTTPSRRPGLRTWASAPDRQSARTATELIAPPFGSTSKRPLRLYNSAQEEGRTPLKGLSALPVHQQSPSASIYDRGPKAPSPFPLSNVDRPGQDMASPSVTKTRAVRGLNLVGLTDSRAANAQHRLPTASIVADSTLAQEQKPGHGTTISRSISTPIGKIDAVQGTHGKENAGEPSSRRFLSHYRFHGA